MSLQITLNICIVFCQITQDFLIDFDLNASRLASLIPVVDLQGEEDTHNDQHHLTDGETFVIDGVELSYSEQQPEPSTDGLRPDTMGNNTTSRKSIPDDYRQELVELARSLSRKKKR